MRARARSSSLVSCQEAAATAAFARTCSGFVAPAMIEPTPGVEASAQIASGELRPAQEARAKHALRKLEALQQELEEKLARVLALYDEKCTR